MDQLNNDKDYLMKRTKICLKHICELAELCVSKILNFIEYVLSFILVLYKKYVQNLEHKAITEALPLDGTHLVAVRGLIH